MTRTFSPVVDIQTKQLIWAGYVNGSYVDTYSAVEIAAHFRKTYSSDVKVEEWRKAHHATYTAK
jgi:hypothetical protein